MNQKGISNVFALKGGVQAWKAAGYPMEKGD
jgi:rhodanese-related sulfurtransferase